MGTIIPTARLVATLERVLPTLWSTFAPLPVGGLADLPVGQARVLARLTAVGRRRMGQLAEDLGVRVPSVTRIVDRLEERGLARRRRCEEDARVVWVEASPRGARLAGRARASRLRAIEESLERLAPEQRTALARALELLDRAFEDADPESDPLQYPGAR
jgi:DNA-binding MarR family transcriptional regulator